MVMAPLILASTSRYRAQLLDQLGVTYRVMPPAYEEEHDLALPPQELVVELARRKALSLQGQPGLVLAADQAPVIDGQVLTKPGNREATRAQLQLLQGRTHRLLTGVALLETGSGRLETALQGVRMQMRPLSEAQIDAYLERDEPYDCAGGYRIEGPGIALFEAMHGDDHTGIVGLPLTRVVHLLAAFGYPVL